MYFECPLWLTLSGVKSHWLRLRYIPGSDLIEIWTCSCVFIIHIRNKQWNGSAD